MKKLLVVLLFALLIGLFTACGGSPETPELVTMSSGDSWSFGIRNCPPGGKTTIYSDVMRITAEGVMLLGQESPLTVGDEVVHEIDCGDGVKSFAFAKIVAFDHNAKTVTVERYKQPVIR